MKFIQTGAGQRLASDLAKIAEANRYTIGREEIARHIVAGHIKVFGTDMTREAARKANQKAKYKFYQI